MSKNMMDELIKKIKEKNSPIVMGIDPRYEMIPDVIKSQFPKDMAGFAESAVIFAKKLIDATYDIIPAVKPQLAYFEMMGPNGLDAFKEVVDYAKSKGLIVIADAKRGDIGTTSQGYSNTFLGETTLDDYKEKMASPYEAAKRGYIDDVIEPVTARQLLISSLKMLEMK